MKHYQNIGRIFDYYGLLLLQLYSYLYNYILYITCAHAQVKLDRLPLQQQRVLVLSTIEHTHKF